MLDRNQIGISVTVIYHFIDPADGALITISAPVPAFSGHNFSFESYPSPGALVAVIYLNKKHFEAL